MSSIELSQIIASDGFRAGVISETERKAAQKVPVYSYYFTWKSPVRDGELKAFHTLEIPFVLENVDNAKAMTGTGEDRYALQEKMSGAWAAFARTGNPNHKGLPCAMRFPTSTVYASRPTQLACIQHDTACSVRPWCSTMNRKW